MVKIYSFLHIVLFSLFSLAEGPVNWQIGFQKAVSPVMQDIYDLHNFILYIIIGIVALVFGLITYIILRYNSQSNITPQQFSHNVAIEIIWTIIPVIILIIIAIPSFKALQKAEEIPHSEMTIKIVGHQWYWNYSYPDNGEFSFDSYMIPDEDLKPGDLRLLEVDNRLVIPENTNIRFLITGGDVIHSFAVPAFGIKTDAIPGRTNETWVRVIEQGVYYGQCSELCGANHGFMPIAVQVVSKNAFEEWLAKAKTKFVSHRLLKSYKLAKQGL